MTSANRAIFQMVLATDSSLSAGERATMQRLVNGQTDIPAAAASGIEDRLLTQKQAAEFLSVNRVTIYRLARDGFLHPVELLPGTLRYSFREIGELARHGVGNRPDVAPSGRAA